MKWVNGSKPVPHSKHTARPHTHQQWKDCEAVRTQPLKRPILLFFTGPEHHLAIRHCFHCPISPAGAVCPKSFSIKTRCKPNHQQQKFDSSFDFCTLNSRGGGGAGGKKSTGNKYPYEEITTSKCNSLVRVFLRKQFSSIWLWACSQCLLQKNQDIQTQINK